jgi:hypothetical protein
VVEHLNSNSNSVQKNHRKDTDGNQEGKKEGRTGLTRMEVLIFELCKCLP